MAKNKNMPGALIMIAALIALAAVLYTHEHTPTQQVDFNQFMESLYRYEISEVTLTDTAYIRFRYESGGTEYITSNPRRETFKEDLLLAGVSVHERVPVIEWQLVFILMLAAGAFVYFRRRPALAKSAMALSLTEAVTSCSFEDMAGNEEAKESVADIVDFLANPKKYAKYGARMPRGLILYGLPGTGKTLMAKAMAGEAKVPFYAVSGSDFVQMYVGVGAARVRELFKKARSAGRAIIFIDEIDALGKKRANSPSGGNDERDQTLNALLTEMSGFTGESNVNNESIIVIAATNRLDTLDDALLRPGRFDRQIEVAMPDTNARKQILELHSKKKPMAADLDKWARDTALFSGAMLETLVNEAAILAAKSDMGKITDADMEKAYYTALAGHEKKDRSCLLLQERKVTAYHEAGHALAAKLTAPENTIAKVSIIPSAKGVGGFCVSIPPEKMYYTKNELEKQIIIHIAGRCAEEIIFGKENITTGAANDIEKATKIIKRYIGEYGMNSDIGMLDMRVLHNDAAVTRACKQMMNRIYADTLQLLSDNLNKLVKIAEALLIKETLNEPELDELISHPNPKNQIRLNQFLHQH